MLLKRKLPWAFTATTAPNPSGDRLYISFHVRHKHETHRNCIIRTDRGRHRARGAMCGLFSGATSAVLSQLRLPFLALSADRIQIYLDYAHRYTGNRTAPSADRMFKISK